MTVFSLLAVGFLMKVVAALFIVCCVCLVLIILIQKGRGGGLSGAFGGAGASGVLGAKTGDFLTWVTIVLVGVFLTLAVVMAKFYKPEVSEFGEDAPAQQVLPTSPEQSSAPTGTGQVTGEINAASDVNTPGG
ncbi:MAG: preprotein translocase subunit SecG [Sedimentisphaerales bacterium]|nr:preprotein translocase subunit SecG [Sedimentisphaerales bacterium]